MNRVFEEVGSIIHGGPGCPVPGCIGEFAAADVLVETAGETQWEGYIFIWNDAFEDFAALADWIRNAGGTDVWIMHVLFSDLNMDRNGRTFDGSRPPVVRWTEVEVPA